ncbi:hypothetical protein GQX73_g9203 [Xylaria multiplex]|uniref:1-alkyl-2-acetylglycerophosphocholine esterase n=1 Tax=Xylaria multiplex TaxID=323545 RepID=A0A7C8MP06_9PEZI|nr:hypothetical protein GQX73_g9203 [Xylaria multiplex]
MARLTKMQKAVSYSLIFALQASAASVVPLPKPKGPYQVGTSVLELVDSSRTDPFAPTIQPRELIISLFYPTERKADCNLALQFPPLTAAYIDGVYNDTKASAERILTQSCLDSPLSHPELPLLLFGPGLGVYFCARSLGPHASRDLTGSMLQLGIPTNMFLFDHPYDARVVEWPNGHAVYAKDSAITNATAGMYLDVRVADMKFVLDALSDPSTVSRIPGLNATVLLPTDKVGAFGHSFGGATSLQLLLNDTRFAVGANHDGILFGSVVEEGTDSPFILFGTNPRMEDDTWTTAWENLRGFKRQYGVNNTEQSVHWSLMPPLNLSREHNLPNQEFSIRVQAPLNPPQISPCMAIIDPRYQIVVHSPTFQ